jgi:teichuronic acid biosynthesis glycosyltransferase TuaG
MPVFNSSDDLSAAVNSILSQTYRDLELIIVDDCSADDSVELIGQLSVLDDRIIAIYNSENKGAGISRNIGIDRAKGEYIAFCDSDDMWVPNKLELQLATMIEKHLDLSYTDVLSINEDQSELLWRMKGLQDPT